MKLTLFVRFYPLLPMDCIIQSRFTIFCFLKQFFRIVDKIVFPITSHHSQFVKIVADAGKGAIFTAVEGSLFHCQTMQSGVYAVRVMIYVGGIIIQ